MRISDWSSDVCSSDLEYTPHIDTGDYIVIVNAEKVKTTGNKLKNKIYYRHTEYPGGIRSTSLEKMLETHPERVLEKAIKGMLPRGPLGYAQFRRSEEHTSELQSLMRISYAVFCLKKKKNQNTES